MVLNEIVWVWALRGMKIVNERTQREVVKRGVVS